MPTVANDANSAFDFFVVFATPLLFLSSVLYKFYYYFHFATHHLYSWPIESISPDGRHDTDCDEFCRRDSDPLDRLLLCRCKCDCDECCA